MATPITMQGINFNKHTTDKYLKDGKPAIALIRCEVHLVENLKANFLIGNNILKSEKFRIDLKKNQVYIGSCGVTIPIDIQSRTTPMHKPIYLKRSTVVPLHNVIPVQVHSLTGMLSDQDFMSESDKVKFSLYAHMVNFETEAILVKNNESRAITISRNFCLGYATEIDYPNALFAGETFQSKESDTKTFSTCSTYDNDIADLAWRHPKSEYKKN